MTGTSARETSRPAQRPRPSATDHPSSSVPPVLFRLPSIGQPSLEESGFSGSIAMSHGALAMGATGSVAPPLGTHAQPARQTAAAQPGAASTLSSTLAAKKIAGQRLLRTLVLLVLLVAIAVISVIVIQRGTEVKPGIAADHSDSKDHLESLSDLRLPDISKPAGQSTAAQNTSAQRSAEPALDAIKSSNPAMGTPQLSLDKSRSTGGASQGGGMTFDAADLARKPNAPAAHVQLGTPIPLRSDASSALAASQGSSPQPGSSSLPLATPRYETVSTPSSVGAAPGTASSTEAGASPSFYDGANKPATLKNDAGSEPILSGSNDSDMSLIPSDYSSSSTKPTGAQAVSNQNSTPANSSGKVASTELGSLGVMVGAGMAEPEFPQAHATSTPELDVAAISSQFLEYSRKKNAAVASTGTEIVNPYAPTNPAAGASAAATTVSTNAAGAPQQSPASAGVPYGTTGATLTPYVRNSPTGAVPSGLGSGPAAAGAGNSAGTAPQSPYSAANPATTVYPSLSAAPGYPQASVVGGSGGYNAASNSGTYNAGPAAGNGFAIPPRGMAANSAQPGADGSPAPQNYGYAAAAGSATVPPPGSANYASNNYASNNRDAAGYRPSAVTSSPYPGGQAPHGMIGQSGFATAPSSDVVGAPPIPVTGTVGFGTSNTR